MVEKSLTTKPVINSVIKAKPPSFIVGRLFAVNAGHSRLTSMPRAMGISVRTSNRLMVSHMGSVWLSCAPVKWVKVALTKGGKVSTIRQLLTKVKVTDRAAYPLASSENMLEPTPPGQKVRIIKPQAMAGSCG